MRRFPQLLLITMLFALLQIPLAAQSSGFYETLRIGRGAINYAEWRPDGEVILVDTVRGAWLYRLGERGLEDAGHLEEARAAHFSPDGSLIAGVNQKNEITLWNTYSLTQNGVMPGHTEYVLSLAWRPETNQFASLDRTGRIIVWDAATREKLLELKLENADQMAWSPNGTYLAAFESKSGKIRGWDSNGELVFTSSPDYPGQENPLIVWRNDSQLLQRDYGETSWGMLWDIASGEGLETSVSYWSDYSPDGTKLAKAGIGSAAIQDYEAGTYLTIERIQAIVVSWSTDGKYVAFGEWKYSENNAQIIIVEGASGSTIQDFEAEFSIEAIYWSPDSKDFIAVDSASQIFVSRFGAVSNNAHTDIGKIAAWHDDGQVIAAASSSNGAGVWDVSTGERLLRMNHSQPATTIAWQPYGNLIAIAVGGDWRGADTNVTVWDFGETSSVNREITGTFTIPHIDLVNGVAWSPDGSTLATVERERYIRLWKPYNPNVIKVIDLWAIRSAPYVDYTQRINSLGWSTNGQILHFSYSSSGNSGGVNLVDVITGTTLLADTPSYYRSTWAWTPDDSRFIWARWGDYGNVPPVLNLSVGGWGITDNREPPLTFSGLENEVAKGIFSPDARFLIGFDKLNHAIIWDVTNVTPLIRLEDINHAVWSPDSTMAAVYDTDGFIRVIDVQTGATIHTFTQHYREDLNEYTDQLQVVWPPDGQKIALLDRGVMYIYQRSD